MVSAMNLNPGKTWAMVQKLNLKKLTDTTERITNLKSLNHLKIYNNKNGNY